MLGRCESGVLESGLLNLKRNEPELKVPTIPAKAAIQLACHDELDSGFRRNDDMDTTSGHSAAAKDRLRIRLSCPTA
jgi:hypothetical protein